MSQLKVPAILSSTILYLSIMSIGLTWGQDESNRRVAYGILLANPMGAASSPYPVYQFPMQQMQQPYYGFGSGYPSGGPMGWGQGMGAGAGAMQPYPAASYGHPGTLAAASGMPGQAGYFGSPGQAAYFGSPLAQMAAAGPYSGYSPLTMIGR